MQDKQPKNKKEMIEKKQSERRAKEAAQREQAEKAKKKNKAIRIAGISGAAAVLLVGGGYLWCNTGSNALRNKVVAETDHYQVTAAMFACYFRQCADSYLRYAERDSEMSVFDTGVSLKEQEYSNGVTWYDLFLDNAMSSVKTNLQYAEKAYDEGFVLSEEDEATVQELTDKADLDRYQKGVRRSDLEKATRLTILANSYQKAAMEQISVSEDEVNSFYQEHQDDYLMVSALAYSFPWSPESILEGDNTEHDAAIEHAEELGKCRDQKAFSDYVYHYLTEEKEMERAEAEQIAANLTITDMAKDFPDGVQEWIGGGAKPGETFVWPREDQLYASVYLLRSEPAADESRTVDIRVIYLSAADYASIEETEEAAEMIQEDVRAAEDPSEMFASIAQSYSGDTKTSANGGLVTGYSAAQTAYGDEISAWAFDRERQHGDMTVSSRTGGVMLAFFEGQNDKTGWENQVENDIYQQKVTAFSEDCTAREVAVKEKNYKYIEPHISVNTTANS